MYSRHSVTVAICSVVFPTLAAVTVGLRIYARKLQTLPYGLDDWLCLLAFGCSIALCAVFANASFNASLGQDLATITPPQFVSYQKHIYAGVITAYSSFGIVKLSVLQFYKRIFAVPRFIHTANIIFAAVSTWLVVTLFLAVFSAWPIQDFWRLGANYSFDHPLFLFYSTIIDTAFDLLILCLPFPMIWKLQMTGRRKCQLVAVFSVGFFCVIAAGLRIHYGVLLSQAGNDNLEQLGNDDFMSEYLALPW
ncbi:Hypothetical protein D9617_30g011740 [Elsinoe fawcettii]|nr:Hypothetical protein D9617_30g011740 [Elsinoe fawcettii]